MECILIVNPYSGKKQSIEILNRIKPIFDSNGIGLSIIETAFSGHAKELAKNLDLNGCDGLLILGGDGTFHEVVNGILNRDDHKTIPIGIIPAGSGNSFLHDLDLVDPIEATQAIISGHTRFVDVTKVDISESVYYSINLIGWGLVTDVGKRAELLRWLGPKRYTVASIIEIFLKKTRKARLIVDKKTIEADFTFIVSCNSVHVGKGMKMAPKAKLDDGLVDLIVVRGNISRRRLLSVLPKLFDGTHINEPEVEYYQAVSFSLFSETSDLLNIDGEMIGTTPITVKIIQNAIEIFG